MRKAGSIALIVVLIPLIIMNTITFSGDADPITTVIAHVEGSVSVEVCPGSADVGSITGNITCETYNDATPCQVQLFADSTIGFVSLTPAGMIFQGVGDDQQEFVLDIIVPLFTRASEEHYCTIGGTWEQGGRSGQVEPDTFQIIVLPYCLPEISCESPDKEVNKGDSVSFKLRINNSGNIDDLYHIEIANSEDLKSKGITADEINDISVVYQGIDEVDVKVHVSSDTTVKGANIDIVVTSTLDEEQEEFPYQLNIEIKEAPFSLGFFTSPLVIVIMLIIIIVVIIIYIKKKKS